MTKSSEDVVFVYDGSVSKVQDPAGFCGAVHDWVNWWKKGFDGLEIDYVLGWEKSGSVEYVNFFVMAHSRKMIAVRIQLAFNTESQRLVISLINNMANLMAGPVMRANMPFDMILMSEEEVSALNNVVHQVLTDVMTK